MELQTDNPTIAAKYIYLRLIDNKGAQFTVPNGAIFWFSASTYFLDDQRGIFVACSKGGAVLFSSPEKVNKFACVRARMPLWAGKFVVDVLKALSLEVQNREVKSDLIIEAESLKLERR